jgi:hypothetical protein
MENLNLTQTKALQTEINTNPEFNNLLRTINTIYYEQENIENDLKLILSEHPDENSDINFRIQLLIDLISSIELNKKIFERIISISEPVNTNETLEQLELQIEEIQSKPFYKGKSFDIARIANKIGKFSNEKINPKIKNYIVEGALKEYQKK